VCSRGNHFGAIAVILEALKRWSIELGIADDVTCGID